MLHPISAVANFYDMYYHVALNKKAYENKWKESNAYADKVKELHDNDSLISRQYHQLNDGKWNHMMSQTHIGYTYWQQPIRQKMPAVKYLTPDAGIDDETPQIISLNKEDNTIDRGIWNKWAAENINIKSSKHSPVSPGRHILKFWLVNPGVEFKSWCWTLETRTKPTWGSEKHWP